jgi:hypothetical protein
MKKLLLLFCFVALATLAANANVVTVSFAPYCDGMYINNPSGPIFGGQHINATCSGANTNGGGFVHGAPGFTYYPNTAYDFSDPLFGLLGENSSIQFLLQVKGTVKKPVECGWVIYYGFDGSGNYLLNAGPCTIVSGVDAIKHIPGAKSTTSR